MAVLGLRFCARAFCSSGKRGPLFIAVHGPLLLRSTGSRCAGSVIVAHGPSCSAACGIFPDQGSNPCPLHWQASSQPLRHQGSPTRVVVLGIGASPHHGTWSLNLLTLPPFIYCINAFKSFITFSQKDWGFDPALLLSCLSMSTASNCAMWCIPHCLWYPAMRLNLSEGVYLQKSCALGRGHLILLYLPLLMCMPWRIIF